jgi:hypothetical protein
MLLFRAAASFLKDFHPPSVAQQASAACRQLDLTQVGSLLKDTLKIIFSDPSLTFARAGLEGLPKPLHLCGARLFCLLADGTSRRGVGARRYARKSPNVSRKIATGNMPARAKIDGAHQAP